METARIQLQSPLTYRGDEHDVSMSIVVHYTPKLNGCGTCEEVTWDIGDVEVEEVTTSVFGRPVHIASCHHRRLFETWYYDDEDLNADVIGNACIDDYNSLYGELRRERQRRADRDDKLCHERRA